MKIENAHITQKNVRTLLIASILAIVILQVPVFASTPATAIADSSVKLLREALRTSKTDQNVLISPDSILTAMVMAENGAAGKTLSEMETAFGGISVSQYNRFLTKLHQRLSNAKTITYRPANSIWYRKNAAVIKKAYLRRMTTSFQARVFAEPFDSRTVKKVNSWVNEATDGKIPSIIRRLNPSNMMLLINAVYFKGEWAEKYESSVKLRFTKESGRTQKADTLCGEENEFVQICGAKGFVKYYSGGETAFMALLPPKGTSVRQYLEKLGGEDLIRGYKNRKSQNVIVRTRLPKFSYDFDISLKAALKKMGIRQAFSKRAADFSGMSENALYIDEVLHKTHIELNESGTEAAAATAVIVSEFSAMPNPAVTIKKVYLNRPFVFAIIDTRTGIPLFLGVVNSI
ncbi:MAG: serpin family protein [Blautia sp.]|nr:serpin family protein [Blautia sp.]